MTEGSKGRGAVELSITLKGLEQPVWRRVRVPADIDLATLHGVVQAAMGWEDSHLHRFEVGTELYGGDEYGHEEDEVLLSDVVRPGEGFTYLYDFGDGWEHELRVDSFADPGESTFVCLAGEGACPPEDSGGVPGYQEILAARRDGGGRVARELEEMVAWMGDFDPTEFDLEEANERLASQLTADQGELWADDDAIEEDVAPPGPGQPHHRGGQVKA